jgi:hypothetical protein
MAVIAFPIIGNLSLANFPTASCMRPTCGLQFYADMVTGFMHDSSTPEAQAHLAQAK